MLEQGHSKNTTLQEWDKIWAINKKHIDSIIPRLTAISNNYAFINILNFNGNEYHKLIAYHIKNEKLGKKIVSYSKTIIIE